MLYDQLLARGTNPALVYYDDSGRLELSGKVLANHIAKIANFLTLELAVDSLRIALPVHWKALTWYFGAKVAGIEVVFEGEAAAVVTDNPTDFAHFSGEVIALSLDSFALSWDGEDGDFYDGSAAVMIQPDALLLSAHAVPSGEAHATAMVNPDIRAAVAGAGAAWNAALPFGILTQAAQADSEGLQL